ncbi:hypothetical protein HGA92_04410 [Candidatus Gracilibacteria bacterium]|nr:hypothetical protein [Candidatus Gracilibacteria bacterium]NUJ98523.1 hypothetical protein [Candidatus Gracilibacteria bacterium]
MFQNEKIVETKICRHCGTSFDITDKDLEFYEKVSPVFPNPGVSFSTPGLKLLENGKIKYLIPSPTLCPDCRNQRRLSWRNDRNLYKRECNKIKKTIISIFSPDKNFTVYDLDFWWSDNWKIEDYFLKINFEKSFFAQFKELLKVVPKRALVKGTGTEKCEYTNLLGASKNCYLIFDSNGDENCFYGSGVVRCTNCIDISYSRDCSYCYSIIDSIYCYNSQYLQNCNECSDSQFLFNCNDCHNCFCCVNLNNKSYCIFNKEYSENDYKKEIQNIKNNSYSLKDFLKFKLKFPIQSLLIRNSENILGNVIFNSKNVKNSFEVYDSENIKYSYYVHSNARDCFDVNVVLNDSFKIYDTALINKTCYNIIFCYDCWNNCENLIYCTECKRTKNSFMCNGLVGKEYCILNKQYTKSEYEVLVPKIIEHMMKTGEWGEFFPSSLSPFGYNETVAQEYYPLTRRDVIPAKAGIYQNENISSETGLEGEINYIDREGTVYKTLEEAGERPVFKWSTYEAPFPKVEKIIPASKLPENIADIPDDILNWAIECEVTKKPFRIIKEELAFYRKHNLPIPRRHPDQRHLDRMSLRNPRHLYTRNCDKCGKEIQTTYAPERPEIVYCEECYNKEMY